MAKGQRLEHFEDRALEVLGLADAEENGVIAGLGAQFNQVGGAAGVHGGPPERLEERFAVHVV